MSSPWEKIDMAALFEIPTHTLIEYALSRESGPKTRTAILALQLLEALKSLPARDVPGVIDTFKEHAFQMLNERMSEKGW